MSKCEKHGWAGMTLCSECYPAKHETDHAEELAKALESIKKHQEKMGGILSFSTTTWHIANKALTKYRESTK